MSLLFSYICRKLDTFTYRLLKAASYNYRVANLYRAGDFRAHTVSNNLLPQILRVSVLQSCEILEYTGHGDIPGAYYAEPAGEVGDRAARCQFFPKDMDRHRQFATLAVVVCISHQFDEAER